MLPSGGVTQLKVSTGLPLRLAYEIDVTEYTVMHLLDVVKG
jgi:hypothetical protein